MQCPTCVTRLNQTVSLMCVGRIAASSYKLRLQLLSKEKQYKHIELVLATKSSSSVSEARQTHIDRHVLTYQIHTLAHALINIQMHAPTHTHRVLTVTTYQSGTKFLPQILNVLLSNLGILHC